MRAKDLPVLLATVSPVLKTGTGTLWALKTYLGNILTSENWDERLPGLGIFYGRSEKELSG